MFDDKIRTMPGEIFNFVLTKDAKPFCVYTPLILPSAYLACTTWTTRQYYQTGRAHRLVCTHSCNTQEDLLTSISVWIFHTSITLLSMRDSNPPLHCGDRQHIHIQSQILHSVWCLYGNHQCWLNIESATHYFYHTSDAKVHTIWSFLH